MSHHKDHVDEPQAVAPRIPQNESVMLMSQEPVPVYKMGNALGILATMDAKGGAGVKTAIDTVLAKGVSILSVIKVILAHAGDIEAIIAAIMALLPVAPAQATE